MAKNLKNALMMTAAKLTDGAALPPSPYPIGGNAADKAQASSDAAGRPIEVITAEINLYKNQMAGNIIEIGKRLIEAKEQLKHGQWAEWLQNSVEFSHSTATRFIQIASEYSNCAALHNLPYTKMLALLQVAPEQREDFVARPHEVGGQQKTVEEMSAREMAAVVKAENERDAALQEKRQTQAALDSTWEKMDELNDQVDNLKAENERMRQDRETFRAHAREEAEQKVSEQLQKQQQQINSMQKPAYLDDELVKEAGDNFQKVIWGAWETFYAVLLAADPALRIEMLEGGALDAQGLAEEVAESLEGFKTTKNTGNNC